MYVHVSVCVHVCRSVCMYVRVHACQCVCVHVRVCMHVHVCVCDQACKNQPCERKQIADFSVFALS